MIALVALLLFPGPAASGVANEHTHIPTGRDITFQVYSALRKKGGDDDARRHFPRDMLPMLEHQQHVKEVDEQFERQEQFEKKYNDEIARISEQIHQIQRR